MLSSDDYDKFVAIVANGIKRTDLLTESEETFVCDMRDKLVKYRRSTNVSDKQASWLDSIETKLRNELGHHYEE